MLSLKTNILHKLKKHLEEKWSLLYKPDPKEVVYGGSLLQVKLWWILGFTDL